MAMIIILVATMTAFAVSITAWVVGAVSMIEAFGLYIGVGFAFMVVSFGFFLMANVVRSGTRSAAAPMSGLATIPVRSSSS